MGKRIYRISPEQALSNLDLIGKDLNLVLKDSTVFFGKLLKTENSLFVCQNKLGKHFEFEATKVREIVYDRPSNY